MVNENLAISLAEFRGALSRTVGAASDESAAGRTLLNEQLFTLDRLFHALGQAALSASEPGHKCELMRLAFKAQAQSVATSRALQDLQPQRVRGYSAEVIEKMTDEELARVAGIGWEEAYELDG